MTCSVPGCANIGSLSGFCNEHYWSTHYYQLEAQVDDLHCKLEGVRKFLNNEKTHVIVTWKDVADLLGITEERAKLLADNRVSSTIKSMRTIEHPWGKETVIELTEEAAKRLQTKGKIPSRNG